MQKEEGEEKGYLGRLIELMNLPLKVLSLFTLLSTLFLFIEYGGRWE